MILENIGSIASYNPDSGKVEISDDSNIFVRDGKISEQAKGKSFDCAGGLVTPGFVDPHTHPVYVDAREDEIARRLAGASYEDIAADGGGINSSIRAVRDSSKNALINRVAKRMDVFLELGTTTIEAKSGYGLNTDSELKSLKVIDEVNKSHPIDMIPTFLGAHATPPEFKHNPEEYVDLICNEMIPAVAEQGIPIFCDVFCENGYFSADQSRRILTVAKENGMKLRMHADEFDDSGAAELAAEVEAISADHLMAISDAGIRAMQEQNVIATLLPGTTHFLGKEGYAPARKLIDEGITVALATDFNPGSCRINSMPYIISLAIDEMYMTVEEAFASATYHAAQSLVIGSNVGSIEIGKQADLIIWEVSALKDIPNRNKSLPIRAVIKRGKVFEVSR
jgi:imidazolonepropionase